VAILHPVGGASEPDPIFYLEGGPGASTLDLLHDAYDLWYAPVFPAHRDLILFDQRGVGSSQPALDCPEVDEVSLELLDHELDGKLLTDQEMNQLVVESYLSCWQKLSEVADLQAYNTVASAADVNDLRLALGYDQINLWSVSYGTRLALGVMRDYPEGLRSVVLDSTTPPDLDLNIEEPANLERSLELLFEDCAADPACTTDFPNLRQVFFETVDRLNQNPAETILTNSVAGKRYPARLGGNDLMALVYQLLGDTQALPVLPWLIYQASQDRLDTINQIRGAILAQSPVWSMGMNRSVWCNEEVSFSSLEQFQANLASYPELAGLFRSSYDGEIDYQECAIWDSGKAAPAENEPVTSDVPALILSGEYDPYTPPAWGQHAAETLKNSHFYVYPDVGHVPSWEEGCPRDMMIAFILDPASAPDDACIGAGPIEMTLFTDRSLGIRGLAPAGWTRRASGVYDRGSSAADRTALVLGKEPVTAEQLLARLASEMGFDANVDRVAQKETGRFTWDVYELEAQGLPLDLALAEEGGSAYYVLLVSEPKERNWLLDKVFWPAVMALVPID
jgi:pimeloyl-ACP methyl ester carboxylesterase